VNLPHQACAWRGLPHCSSGCNAATCRGSAGTTWVFRSRILGLLARSCPRGVPTGRNEPSQSLTALRVLCRTRLGAATPYTRLSKNRCSEGTVNLPCIAGAWLASHCVQDVLCPRGFIPCQPLPLLWQGLSPLKTRKRGTVRDSGHLGSRNCLLSSLHKKGGGASKALPPFLKDTY
jgi:hypothetical protein